MIAHPYPAGSLLAGVGGGKIKLYDAVGRVIDVLDTRSRSTEEKGMCFDRAGNLYVSNFDADSMSKFDSRGRLIAYPWGIRFKTSPSSCVADRAGHIYVGEAAGSKRLLKFDAAGHLLAAFRPALQNVGIDSMDLAADQCTLYYTSQGSSIKRFDVCTHKQLPDFATGVAAQCYGLRLRPGGEVLVACLSAVYRLNAHGKKIATYAAAHLGERNRCRATARNQCDVWTTALVALALDRDGRSFWTATLESGHLYRIDLASGRTLAAFTAAPYQLLANVAMVGEPDAALTGASGSRLCPAPASALTVRSQVTPKDLVTGGTLAFVVQTAPRASINAVVQVAVVKTVTDALKRRTQVIQTMVLHPTASGLVADAHGRLAGHIRLSYATARPLQARLVVTVHLGCATRAQSTAIRLLPRNKPGTPIAATS